MELNELRDRLPAFCRAKYGVPNVAITEAVTMPGHAGFAYGFRVEVDGRVDSWFIRLPPPNVKWQGTADVLRRPLQRDDPRHDRSLVHKDLRQRR